MTLSTRCPSLTDDSTTPSGMTQCADEQGHDGPHWHVNDARSMAWNDPPANDAAMRTYPMPRYESGEKVTDHDFQG